MKHAISNTQELPLSDIDRITYIFKYIKTKNKPIIVTEVVNVSYEIFIDEKWMTIVRCDSAHGYLHRHIRFSLINIEETVSIQGVIKKGDHAKWLTWAIGDIRSKSRHYKKEFLKRSKD